MVERLVVPIVVVVFDSASNAQIGDAIVTAKVSALGLSMPQKTLERMKIADTVTYDAYIDLTADFCTIRVLVARLGAQPDILDFKYDRRSCRFSA